MKVSETMNQLDFFSVATANWTKVSTKMQQKIIDQLAVILIPFIELIITSEQTDQEDQSCQG